MAADRKAFVAAFHQSTAQVVLVVTGGGSGAISALLQVPGASQTVLEATVPYASEALDQYLGRPPEQYCSETTARHLAMAAYQRARKYRSNSPEAGCVGLGCTASLRSDRPKRGDHRLHLAWQTAQRTVALSLTLAKEARSRLDEEELACDLILNCLAEAAGMSERLTVSLLDGEVPVRSEVEAPLAWEELLAGRIERGGHGRRILEQHPAVVFPGAFAPLHEGHRRMREIAESLLGERVAFEISLLNVDKPPLDFVEMRRRLDQFGDDDPVYFSRAATFREKARVFPGATFVVGADTIRRIAEPRYYHGSRQECLEAIREIGALGCRFLVFGRVADGTFVSLHELGLPPELNDLCQEVPEEQFREDISSTELRERGAWPI